MQDRLNADYKAAMLAKNAQRVSVLRSLKSAITYALAAPGAPERLEDAKLIELFTKEAKKRQESADSYAAAGRTEQAASEQAEKAIIEEYLPRELGEAELAEMVDEAVEALGDDVSPKAMGQVIAAVKQQANGRVDGALLARLVKERLAQ